jgi:hypothetical protein
MWFKELIHVLFSRHNLWWQNAIILIILAAAIAFLIFVLYKLFFSKFKIKQIKVGNVAIEMKSPESVHEKPSEISTEVKEQIQEAVQEAVQEVLDDNQKKV